MKSSTIYTVKPISIAYFLSSRKRKTVCDQFLRLYRDYSLLRRSLYTIEISFTMWIVEWFTLHLVVYFIFPYEVILLDKKMK